MMGTRNSRVCDHREKGDIGVDADIGADTLIVWTEPNGIDMALSFQEAEGCGAIWYVGDNARNWEVK